MFPPPSSSRFFFLFSQTAEWPLLMPGGGSQFGTGGLIIWKVEGGHPSATPKAGGSCLPEGAQRRGRPAAAASIFTQGCSCSCCAPGRSGAGRPDEVIYAFRNNWLNKRPLPPSHLPSIFSPYIPLRLLRLLTLLTLEICLTLGARCNYPASGSAYKLLISPMIYTVRCESLRW